MQTNGPGWIHMASADKKSAAIMSADADGHLNWTYRYALLRRWSDIHPEWHNTPWEVNLLWCMLNPSTADHSVDDATVRRVVGFSRGFGADACTVVNLFALRSTDPRLLRTHADPVGPLNDTILKAMASQTSRVVCAWGAHGALLNNRGREVLDLFRAAGAVTLSLGVTKDGHPKHPLYLSSTFELEDFTG